MSRRNRSISCPRVPSKAVDREAITTSAAAATFLVLLIGIGPKLALLPYLQLTAPLNSDMRQRVRRTMLQTAGGAAIALIVLGELLRVLLHFTVGSLSIAGGVILLVLAVGMVLGRADNDIHIQGKNPIQLAHVPLAVPYLLNPVGIVGLVTISAEAESINTLFMALAMLGVVLVIDWAVFRWAHKITARLNEDRMLVTEKVFGFLIGAIAVQLVLDGLASSDVIGPLVHAGFDTVNAMPR
jgi:multiple antibiotic resistance protein